MNKFGKFVCKYRVAIIIVALLLLIPSAIGMVATRINYDILTYLPDDVATIQGQRSKYFVLTVQHGFVCSFDFR